MEESELEKHEFAVTPKNAGKRLDVFLVEVFKNRFSRSFVKKLITDGGASIGSKKLKAHYIVHDGDNVSLEVSEPEPLHIGPENIPIDIVYEDNDVVVVNKHAGMVVHPAPGNYSGTLVNALLYHCKDLSGIGGILRPGIVHRLDKDTSGLLVVAKNDLAHRSLAKQFKSKKAKRVYVALARNIVELDNGIIELPIGRHPTDRKRMGVVFTDGREARTKYSVIKRFEDFTLLELTLETGRTHQIRVHLAHMGHPIIGDKTYGSSKGLNRQALHAKSLTFIHPHTKKLMEFESKIPHDIQRLVDKGKLN